MLFNVTKIIQTYIYIVTDKNNLREMYEQVRLTLFVNCVSIIKL